MFTEQEINDLYLTKIKLPESYFNKYGNKIPKCPVKSFDYIWSYRDFPRNFCILDFIEWIKNHKITIEHLGYTCESDPELEFIYPSKKTLVSYPSYDLHNISNYYKEEFDFFIFNQTLEHLYNPFEAVKQIYNINIPHMTPIHFNGFTPMGLAMLFKTANFEIIEIGQWGNYEYISKLFDTHTWPGFNKLNDFTNVEKNVVQCWILVRKL